MFENVCVGGAGRVLAPGYAGTGGFTKMLDPLLLKSRVEEECQGHGHSDQSVFS